MGRIARGAAALLSLALAMSIGAQTRDGEPRLGERPDGDARIGEAPPEQEGEWRPLLSASDLDQIQRERSEAIRTDVEIGRELERMPVIDRNILRLAIYEMLFESNVPMVVIVDEAIELAKKFGSENSGRFVNGLLDAVLKSKAGASPADSTRSGRAVARTSSGSSV